MQGWRPTMEDYVTIELSLSGKQGWNFFAVFDGHIDDKVAKELSAKLHIKLIDKINSMKS